MKLFLILLMFVYSVDAEQKFIFPFLTPLTDRVVTEINALKPTWKAGKNFHGTAIPISKLVATRPEETLSTFREIIYPNTTLPESFDAREAWPNCPSIGKIYDQKKGFPSWIYPTVGSIADRLCIKAGIQIDVEATVERIMKSNGDYNSAYNSANIRDNIYYWSKKGIFTVSKVKDEICLPFAPKGCKPNVIKLDKYFKVIAAQPKNAKDIMSDLMLNGPIPANMGVYTDFPSYQSGVYMPTSYWSQGLHSMKLIGWGTENGTDYWLATNSWGTEWGEKGYFKIQRKTRLYGTILYGISPSLVRTDVISEIRKNPVDDQLFQLA